jgi:hypothetical protein
MPIVVYRNALNFIPMAAAVLNNKSAALNRLYSPKMPFRANQMGVMYQQRITRAESLLQLWLGHAMNSK